MVDNSSPLGTQAGDFCVYLLCIEPEKRMAPIYIEIFHQGVRPQPHLVSMMTVQKQLIRNKKGLWGMGWLG